MNSNFQRFLGSVAPEDGSYRAWLTCQQGETASLKLVPITGKGQPVRYIPYLQPMTIEYRGGRGNSDQLLRWID